jgi:hypothetical protein
MRATLIAALWAGSIIAGPLFTTTNDATWKKWDAIRGTAQADNVVHRDGRSALRLESNGGDAYVISAPVSLKIGRQYELSGWIRTESVTVRDLDRSPIAVGATLSMASMPFDVHSESIAGTRDWTRLAVRFIATRAEDSIALSVANGGAFSGKAWFDGVSIDEASTSGNWPSRAAVKTFGPAYRYPSAGWIYLHIEGAPYERGYQHGRLMAPEIETYIDRCAAQLDSTSRATAWQNGRTAANAMFLRGFDAEILEEMKGIADGAAAAGGKYDGHPIDLVDIVTANTVVELGELASAVRVTPTGLEGLGLKRPNYAGDGGVPHNDRCSAFAATGKATRDGHMVIAHTTWWPLTLAEQTNVLLDIQPKTGHRVLMQSYPGGIESGTDWYQNDAGVVLTETTIEQSPFNVNGTSVAYRARKAIQYGDNVDQVVEYLKTKNNGLYTNEWLIGDGKNDEVAMLELGTNRTRLWRSSRNEWFGGTEGFYWGCNNAKDATVRLEYQPDPKGEPRFVGFSPAPRDIKWLELYDKNKGKIDEQFAFLALRTAPLVSSHAMDAKVANAAMASNLMVWAAFGKPNEREWIPGNRRASGYSGNEGLYPSGYRLFTTAPDEALRSIVAGNERERLARPPQPSPGLKPEDKSRVDETKLWKGWILPASDSDIWLAAGSAAYYRSLSSDDVPRELNRLRAEYRGAALQGDVALSQLRPELRSANWRKIAESKGALLLNVLRSEIGDDRFFNLMKSFFEANTTKHVTTAAFRTEAAKIAGKPLDTLFDRWLNGVGLPSDSGGPAYVAADVMARLGSALIVYGTNADAGANRFAAEQLQKHYLDLFESAVPIRKDFELTEADLQTHDVVFVGRPESNSALAAIAQRIRLNYAGGEFRINGGEHASEYDALVMAAANPLDPKRMVLVLAGNSALQTVKLALASLAGSEYAVYSHGKETAAGFRRSTE